MNVNQIIKSLCDRPLADILEVQREILSECERRLKSSENSPGVDPVQLELLNYQIAQQIWTQCAVWNKFGNEESVFSSAEELNLSVAPLLTSPRVVKYMASVNDQVAAAQFDEGSLQDGSAVNIPHSVQDLSTAGSSKRSTRKLHQLDTVDGASSKLPKESLDQHVNVSEEERSDSVDRWANHSDADQQEDGGEEVMIIEKPGEPDHSGGGERAEEEENYSSRLRVRPVKKAKRKAGYPSSAQPKTVKPRTALNKWTEYMLNRLDEGTRLYKGHSWDKVARHVGFKVTAAQCAATWSARDKIQQPPKVTKKARWTNAEAARLSQLVAEKVIPSQWSEEVQGTVPERVDWFRIAQELDRPPRACKNKHLALLKSASQARAGQEIMNKVMGMAAVKEEKEEKEEKEVKEEKVSDDGEKDGGGESGTESGSESDTEGEGENEGEDEVVRERDHREGGKMREKEVTDGVSEGEGEDDAMSAGSDGEKTQEMNDSMESAVVDLTVVEAL